MQLETTCSAPLRIRCVCLSLCVHPDKNDQDALSTWLTLIFFIFTCSTGHFRISRPVECSPKSQMKVPAVVSSLFAFYSLTTIILVPGSNDSVCAHSSDLCSVPPRWTYFWHRDCWFSNQDLGFEGAYKCGQLPRPLWTRHLHCFLWEWILSGHRLELLPTSVLWSNIQYIPTCLFILTCNCI